MSRVQNIIYTAMSFTTQQYKITVSDRSYEETSAVVLSASEANKQQPASVVLRLRGLAIRLLRIGENGRILLT